MLLWNWKRWEDFWSMRRMVTFRYKHLFEQNQWTHIQVDISETTHEKWINLCLLQHQHQHLADIIMNGSIFYTFLEILNGIRSENIFHWICWKALNYRDRTSSYVQIIIKWDAHWNRLKHMVWLLNVSIYDSFNEQKHDIYEDKWY